MKKKIGCVMLGAVSFLLSACDPGVEQGVAENSTIGHETAALVAPEATPGQGRDVAGLSRLGPLYTEGALAYHGGWGGGYFGHVTPPAVIYAVQVNSGIYVDHVRFAWYQPSGADNLYRSGDNWGSTGVIGGGGGTENGWWYCPAGKGIIGIVGGNGAYVNALGVICGDVNSPNPYNPLNTYSPVWGSNGGWWFGSDVCAPGRLVDGFNTRSGIYLDGIQAICINAH